MPALQVRDFPDHMYEELKAAAQRDHRSIAQQTIYAVEQYLKAQRRGVEEQDTWTNRTKQAEDERQERIKKREALFEKLSKMPPHEVPEGFPSAAELIREDRDNR